MWEFPSRSSSKIEDLLSDTLSVRWGSTPWYGCVRSSQRAQYQFLNTVNPKCPKIIDNRKSENIFSIFSEGKKRVDASYTNSTSAQRKAIVGTENHCPTKTSFANGLVHSLATWARYTVPEGLTIYAESELLILLDQVLTGNSLHCQFSTLHYFWPANM